MKDCRAVCLGREDFGRPDTVCLFRSGVPSFVDGDTAQLPPVGEELSPALFADALKGYGLEVREVDLTQVVRQIQESGILWNATQLRQLIAEDNCYSLPKIKITGFPDIKMVPGTELIDAITSCYDHDGMDETIVICRSNKRANLYNNGIRAQILWREDELNTGDMLMIAKNNYYGQSNIRKWTSLPMRNSSRASCP